MKVSTLKPQIQDWKVGNLFWFSKEGREVLEIFLSKSNMSVPGLVKVVAIIPRKAEDQEWIAFFVRLQSPIYLKTIFDLQIREDGSAVIDNVLSFQKNEINRYWPSKKRLQKENEDLFNCACCHKPLNIISNWIRICKDCEE